MFYLIYDAKNEPDESLCKALSIQKKTSYTDDLPELKQFLSQIELASDEERATLVFYLGDEQIHHIFSNIEIEERYKIALLPHPHCEEIRQGWGIATDMDKAIEDIQNQENHREMDLMYCNGEPVFNTVVVGDALTLISKNEVSFWTSVYNYLLMLRRLPNMRLQPFNFEISEDKSIKTAALGILVVQHGRSTMLSRLLLDTSHINDGMMHSLIIAPRSLIGLALFGIRSIYDGNRKLPPFTAHIKDKGVRITSPTEFFFTIDGQSRKAKALDIEVAHKKVKVCTGRHLNTQDKTGGGSKAFRTDALPKGELRKALTVRKLPWIKHATTEEFSELFKTLRDNSRTKSSFLVMMVLSSLIATLGLFANSTPVVIGAMILAPLMSPIISLSMGILRQDYKLTSDSAKTVLWGLIFALFCAFFLTILTPLRVFNDEIMARISPSLLDLGIAVFSGVAGAYAHSREEVAKTLAGTAIAVALVPPIAVSGIGLGWANWEVFGGALLLLLTNLVGMVLATALTFLLLGFSGFNLAKKGLLVALVLVIIVSIPLGYGFSKIVKKNEIVEVLSQWKHKDKDNEMYLRDIKVRGLSPVRVSCKVIATKSLDDEDFEALKNKLKKSIGEDFELEISVGLKK
ncbi:MAG: TIGR00341 family protein [Bernardetiaceae bacterium]|nr:TIGR00341 family protein [Bernardetiaceae bacterium]